MKNARKIVIFVLLWVLFVQNSFFGDVFAQSAVCPMPATYNSCGDYWSEYSKKTKIKNPDTGKNETCCECAKEEIDNSCDAYWAGYIWNKAWCCMFSCATCKKASFEFQTYVNFQVDMIQILRKAVRVEDELSDNRKEWLFSAGILSLPANMIKAWSEAFKKWAEELTDGLKAAKMWSIMLTSITTEMVSKDSGWWLLILFRNKPFVREWTTLQDLDLSLHDAMRDLWMEWIWDDEISSDLMKDMSNLQQKYLKNSWNELGLFSTFKTPGSVKYKDMVYMLLRLNGMMKTFVSMDHSSPVNSKVINRWWISISFNPALMEDMVVSYACASWISACSSTWKDFANNTKVRKQISDWFDGAMDTINKANDDFSAVMLSFKSSVKDTFGDKDVAEETWLTPKQLAILRTAYGIDTTKLSKEQWIWLESLFNGNAWKNLVSSINMKPLDYFSAENKAAREKASKEKSQAKQDAKYMAALSFSETAAIEAEIKAKANTVATRNKVELTSSLQATLDSVFMQKQEDKSLFMIYSNMSVTQYFVEIGSLMHNILEISIWTKDTKWLVKYLWDTCEAQCVSKWTSNCFAK